MYLLYCWGYEGIYVNKIYLQNLPSEEGKLFDKSFFTFLVL